MPSRTWRQTTCPMQKAPLAAHLKCHVMAAFKRNRRTGDTRYRNSGAGVEIETGRVDLTFPGREIDGAYIHLLSEAFVHQVHDKGARLADIGGRILDGAIRARLQPENDEWRLFAEYVEERERRCIDNAVGPNRSDKRDRPRHHKTYEELVAKRLRKSLEIEGHWICVSKLNLLAAGQFRSGW
jgi:hypothetical protein